MTWKQELGFLQHLPDVAAHLSLPSSFQSCSHSTTLPQLASVVGWTRHHFAEFRGMAPYFGCWKPSEIEELVLRKSLFHISSFPLKFQCANPSLLHLTPHCWRHTLWYRGILALEKKCFKNTESFNVPIYTMHEGRKPAKERYFSVGGRLISPRGRGRGVPPILPLAPLNKACYEHTADISHSRAAGSIVPCPFHTTHYFSRPPVPVWQQRTWSGVACHGWQHAEHCWSSSSEQSWRASSSIYGRRQWIFFISVIIHSGGRFPATLPNLYNWFSLFLHVVSHVCPQSFS